MGERIAGAAAQLPALAAAHLLLSGAALLLALIVGLPLAVASARAPRLGRVALAFASLVQTIPGLALLALFYPLLLGLSALVGGGISALGFLPSLLALALYALLPILRNGITGLTGIDPAILEAADGIGMTRGQRLRLVEAPLAAPVFMAGIRTAAVWTIGAATLSTPVGQTSLGNYIFSGLQTENWVFVLFGCGASAALALVVDQLLGLIEAGAERRDLRRIGVGLAGLALGAAVAVAPMVRAAPATYVVGAKNFSEQFILASMMQTRLERAGAQVQRKDGLGSAIAFRALAAGDIDVYVDYSGTLWTNVMGRKDSPPRAAMLAEITRFMRDRYGVGVLGSLGFENAYALAMKADRAGALGAASLSDLAVRAPQLTLGGDLEFLSRPEWTAIRTAYGLRFRTQKSFNPTFMYRAIEGGEADVISAFSSDGRIAADHLVVLSDPKHAIPAYDAVVLISPRRVHDARLKRALQPLLGRIAVERMREANLMVDRDQDKRSPEEAGRWLAAASGLQ